MSLLEEQVIQTILSSNLYMGNQKVLGLEELSTTAYSSQTAEQLMTILKNGEYDKLNIFAPPVDLLGEELTVIRFRNERDKIYYGIYYDSFELWQKPEIVAIYQEICPST